MLFECNFYGSVHTELIHLCSCNDINGKAKVVKNNQNVFIKLKI